MKKNIIKYIITFIILLLIFNLLLFVTSLFPSSWIENRVRESSQILNEEGNLYHFKIFNVENNNYTDSLIINECYSIDNTDPIFSYMSCRKNYQKGITQKQEPDIVGELFSVSNDSVKDEKYDPVKELSEFLNGKVTISYEYARYWHGYLTLYRVLLIFFNIKGIRIALFVLFVFLYIRLFYLLKKQFGVYIAIIFALSLLGVDYFHVAYSLESAPVFITMMLSSIIVLKRIDKIENLYLYQFVIGCICNFVDYLTVPLITLAMPLLIYILSKMQKENLHTKECLKMIFLSCIAWGIGYAATWISKWAIYDIVFEKNMIINAISQVIYRSGMTIPSSQVSIYFTVCVFLLNTLRRFFIFELVILIIKIKCKDYTTEGYDLPDLLKKCIPFVIIGILPIIWYCLLSNHTVVHPRFTYRHTLILLVCLLLSLNTITQNKGKLGKFE